MPASWRPGACALPHDQPATCREHACVFLRRRRRCWCVWAVEGSEEIVVEGGKARLAPKSRILEFGSQPLTNREPLLALNLGEHLKGAMKSLLL